MMTVCEVFEQAKSLLPAGALLASGGLADARGLSDVDVIVYDALGENREYALAGYARPVNVILTTDDGMLRSVLHREIELALEQDHPALARLAFAKKASGMSTEAAWASVLDLPGCPYVAMANRAAVQAAAASQGSLLAT